VQGQGCRPAWMSNRVSSGEQLRLLGSELVVTQDASVAKRRQLAQLVGNIYGSRRLVHHDLLRVLPCLNGKPESVKNMAKVGVDDAGDVSRCSCDVNDERPGPDALSGLSKASALDSKVVFTPAASKVFSLSIFFEIGLRKVMVAATTTAGQVSALTYSNTSSAVVTA